jgi:hypothetical protein
MSAYLSLYNGLANQSGGLAKQEKGEKGGVPIIRKVFFPARDSGTEGYISLARFCRCF